MQVEDIIDTGATLKRVVARLQEAGAASVKVLLAQLSPAGHAAHWWCSVGKDHLQLSASSNCFHNP